MNCFWSRLGPGFVVYVVSVLVVVVVNLLLWLLVFVLVLVVTSVIGIGLFLSCVDMLQVSRCDVEM